MLVSRGQYVNQRQCLFIAGFGRLGEGRAGGEQAQCGWGWEVGGCRSRG